MKTGLADNSLKSASLTLAAIAVITLTDGTVLYFTELDKTIKIGGNRYRSDLPYQGSAVQLALGTSGETQTLTVVIGPNSDPLAVSLKMIFQGRLNQAAVVVSWVDYENLGAGQLDHYSGYVTAVDFADAGNAVLHIQSILGVDRPLCGDVYGNICRYDFGDSDCGVDITPTQDEPYIYQVLDNQTFKTGALETSPVGYYRNGTCAFLNGTLTGKVFEIADNEADTDGRYIFTLKVPMPEIPLDSFTGSPGAHILLTAGCDKIISSGCTYWHNVLRFGGEPFVPQSKIIAPPFVPPSNPVTVLPDASVTPPASTTSVPAVYLGLYPPNGSVATP